MTFTFFQSSRSSSDSHDLSKIIGSGLAVASTSSHSTSPQFLVTWASQRAALPAKTDMKKGFSASDFHVSFADRSSSAVGPHFPPSLPFAADVLKVLFVTFHIPNRLVFPNPIPAPSDSISVFCLVPEQAKVCSPKGQGCNPPFCFTLFLLGS